MINDDLIKKEWQRLDNENIRMACEYLRKHEGDISDYMAEFVASLCNIDVEQMLSETSVAYIAQPRWLYWYAIRYMTKETYEKISLITERKSGNHFTPNGIGQCINKMAVLINREPIWAKRWTIIKHIIKIRESNISDTQTVTMKLIAPKGVKVELKNE